MCWFPPAVYVNIRRKTKCKQPVKQRAFPPFCALRWLIILIWLLNGSALWRTSKPLVSRRLTRKHLIPLPGQQTFVFNNTSRSQPCLLWFRTVVLSGNTQRKRASMQCWIDGLNVHNLGHSGGGPNNLCSITQVLNCEEEEEQLKGGTFLCVLGDFGLLRSELEDVPQFCYLLFG